jgi:hypothetical protein
MTEPEPFVDARVTDLLRALGLQGHAPTFERAEVRFEHLPRLTEEGLTRLGLVDAEERRRLLDATSALRHLSGSSSGAAEAHAAPPSFAQPAGGPSGLAVPASPAPGPAGLVAPVPASSSGIPAPAPAAPTPAAQAVSQQPVAAVIQATPVADRARWPWVLGGALVAAGLVGGTALVVASQAPPPQQIIIERPSEPPPTASAAASAAPLEEAPSGVAEAPARQGVNITALATPRVSSELPPEHGATFGPGNLVDGDLETCWQPLAKDRHGVGEWVSFTFGRTYAITRIDIANGFQRFFQGRDLFLDNARADHVEVDFGVTRKAVRLRADKRDFLGFSTETPVVTDRLTLRIRSVHYGAQWPDVALSEVRIFGYAQD